MKVDSENKVELEEIMARLLLIKKMVDDSLEIISKQRIKFYQETQEDFKKVVKKVKRLRIGAEEKLENLLRENNNYIYGYDAVSIRVDDKVDLLDIEIQKAFVQKKEIYKKTQTMLDKVNYNIKMERASLDVKFEEALAYKNKVYKEILEKVKGINSVLYQSIKEELKFKY
jgi:hypothetical protein